MAIIYENDTISAQATPFGTGAVAIIRLSGEKSFEIVQKFFSKKIEPGKILFGKIVDNGVFIDEVIVLAFEAPHGYTGENSVEIQCHGGIHVTNKIKELTFKYGARPAERGEFTKRAFLNGKMDLSEAEAVADLIHAKTSKFAVKSAQNLCGKLSVETGKIYDDLFAIMSAIVAATDFPEDVAEPDRDDVSAKISTAVAKIKSLLKVSKGSDILRQGVKAALIGRPNVGKSSLFNALLNFERAIVTDTAGTTRDTIRETLDIEGIPVTFIDTAGLRAKSDADKIESIGMDFSEKAAEEADIILFLFDSAAGMTDDDRKIFEMVENLNKPVLKIASKSDIATKSYENCLNVSTFDQNSVENLKNAIKQAVCTDLDEETEYITNERQQHCLEKALTACNNALEGIRMQMPFDLVGIDLKSALLELGDIKGELVTDDILNNIFDHFCIGK